MEIDNGVEEEEEEEFGFSRNYFLAKELGGSGKKSASKLSDIDLVDEQELRTAASNIEPKHEKEVVALMNSYMSLYPKWVFELRCGFGLLMYGFGSKKALIEDFASTALTEYSVFVINGYLQSINIKQVVISLADVLWDQLKTKRATTSGNMPKVQQPFNSRSMDDLLAFLNGSQAQDKDCFVCVVIHNIDGPGLRDSETQQYLGQIAACSCIRVVASIDHVNAPLLWDKKMVHTQFNWCWYHVPTFAPYRVEGMFFPMILAHGNTTQSAKTAAIVLQSLTPNAQSVFRVLADYQLAHPDEEGMPINNLYTICRERFLVSSQVTLNSHLTEFKDHELVKIVRKIMSFQRYPHPPPPDPYGPPPPPPPHMYGPPPPPSHPDFYHPPPPPPHQHQPPGPPPYHHHPPGPPPPPNYGYGPPPGPPPPPFLDPYGPPPPPWHRPPPPY